MEANLFAQIPESIHFFNHKICKEKKLGHLLLHKIMLTHSLD